jgi:hypothetical protein
MLELIDDGITSQAVGVVGDPDQRFGEVDRVATKDQAAEAQEGVGRRERGPLIALSEGLSLGDAHRR